MKIISNVYNLKTKENNVNQGIFPNTKKQANLNINPQQLWGISEGPKWTNLIIWGERKITDVAKEEGLTHKGDFKWGFQTWWDSKTIQSRFDIMNHKSQGKLTGKFPLMFQELQFSTTLTYRKNFLQRKSLNTHLSFILIWDFPYQLMSKLG